MANACEPVDKALVMETVARVAQEEGLDADLALAVVDVESGSGQVQVSAAGATGVMQLMPATARDYGVADRCETEPNIRAGVRYLKDLYDDFGDPLLMLAAYNAGPERVFQKGGIPEYNETAQYIVKVMNRWKLNAMTTVAADKRAGGKSEEHPKAAPPWRDQHVWGVD